MLPPTSPVIRIGSPLQKRMIVLGMALSPGLAFLMQIGSNMFFFYKSLKFRTKITIIRLYRPCTLMQTLSIRWGSTQCQWLRLKGPNSGKCWVAGPFSSSTTCSSNLPNKSRKYRKSMDWLWLCILGHCVQYKLQGTVECSFLSIDKLHLLRWWPDTLMTRLWETQKTTHSQIWNSYYQHFISCYFAAIFSKTWDHYTQGPSS